MQTNKPYILLTLILLFFTQVNSAQKTASKKKGKATNTAARVSAKITDTIVVDSIKKQPILLGKVKHKALDYQKISQKDNKLYLYNQAELFYQDTELKAGIIILDYAKKEVYAGRIKDSTGTYTQYPYFKQGNNVVEPDSIRFNFDTKKALIWNSKSEQSNGANVYAQVTKKENDSTYFMKEGRITTSTNLEDPEYYIRIRKAKFVPKKKIIAGFSNMYIADVPTPIAVPFAYFPLTQERRSGVLFPTFGENGNRGYFLQNGGYYFALSKYFDLALLGDYYTNGTYGVRVETDYKSRYNFNGSFRFKYENQVVSQRGFPDYGKSTIYNLTWSHRQDPKASPNSNFSAAVNIGSGKYYQQSFNQVNTPNRFNNTLSSTISYAKSLPSVNGLNVSLTASHSQNTNTGVVNLTLPTLQTSMNRIYPFAKKSGIKKGIIQNINLQHTLNAQNSFSTTEEELFSSKMFKEGKVGIRQSVPIATNFKILKYLSTSVTANYNEVWYLKSIKRQDYDAALQQAVIDTISGFDSYRTYNVGASIGTSLYGTFDFGKDKKIQAIRHVMRPSVSYGYNPSFASYYEKYIADAQGTVREYTRFDGGIYGAPGKNSSSSVGIQVNNNLEAKVKTKDSLAGGGKGYKKIILLNNLNFSTSYNVKADSLAWSPVNFSGSTQLFKNKMNVNFAGQLDPYAIDNNGTRINTFNINNGGSLFRLTRASMNLSYSFSSKNFNKKKQNNDYSSSGGREDDLFGTSTDFSQTQTQEQDTDSNTTTNNKRFSTAIPWDLRLIYNVGYNNNARQNEINNNSLMFSGNIELGTRWKIGLSSGYDFKRKGISNCQLRFERDLESWRMNFAWTPIGIYNTWNFFIGIKSSLLSDIKWEKRREPDAQL